MSLEVNIKHALTQRALQVKRVKLGNEEEKQVAEIVSNLINYMKYFNSKKDTFTLFNKSLDDIPVLNELKDLIMPLSVRVIPSDLMWADLLRKGNLDEVDANFCPTYMHYIETITKFRALFKLGADTDVSSLASLRKNISLVDALPYAIVDGKCDYKDKPFIPFEVDYVANLERPGMHYNVDASEVINDYFISIKW